MTRIEPADLPSDLAVHNHLVAAVYRNPELFRGFASLSGRVHSGSHLSDRLRELVVLAVVGHLGAAYEQEQHEAIAGTRGVTDEEMVALRHGDTTGLPAADRIAVEYAIAVETRTVDDARWAQARGHFSEVELLDITLLAGFYGLASRLVLALAVDLED